MKNDDAQRKRLIKLIHVARRELGMQDEDYRSMLASMPALGGRTSSADLGVRGLELVMDALKARGFTVRKNPKVVTRKLAADSQSKKIRSLWIQLHKAGKVRDSSERALNSYVSHKFNVDDMSWLSSGQASLAIEQLKRWLAREEVKRG